MHTIEPFDRWQELYNSSEDVRSPLHGRTYSETTCRNTVYNYYIHPQWDEFGSATLYLKIIYVNYSLGFCVVELMGEWNDVLYNDIMFLKRNIIEQMIEEGITKFILIGENILNFHADDDSYYQEWCEDLDGGWITLINLRDHVIKEFKQAHLNWYIELGDLLQTVKWRTLSPLDLYTGIDKYLTNRLMAPAINS